MLQRLVDDIQTRAGIAIRLSSLAGAAAVSIFIAMGFLAAAGFVFVLQREGERKRKGRKDQKTTGKRLPEANTKPNAD